MRLLGGRTPEPARGLKGFDSTVCLDTAGRPQTAAGGVNLVSGRRAPPPRVRLLQPDSREPCRRSTGSSILLPHLRRHSGSAHLCGGCHKQHHSDRSRQGQAWRGRGVACDMNAWENWANPPAFSLPAPVPWLLATPLHTPSIGSTSHTPVITLS
jgi:hypothetical protein